MKAGDLAVATGEGGVRVWDSYVVAEQPDIWVPLLCCVQRLHTLILGSPATI